MYADRLDRTITLPLSPGHWAYLRFGWPISSQEWSMLERLLSKMKPGLVEPALAPKGGDDADGAADVGKGLANVIGRWPGDESDEEVNDALEKLS